MDKNGGKKVLYTKSILAMIAMEMELGIWGGIISKRLSGRTGSGCALARPIYKSPNDDNGYDISDYRDIMDEFGTLDDFDELLAQSS